MLTDEQLNPMKRGAPLLVERYRELRERMKVAAGLLAASGDSLKAARLEIGILREGIQAEITQLKERLRLDKDTIDELKREIQELQARLAKPE